MTGFRIVPVILCGGVGSRLWPVSRDSLPKQFLTLVGDKSLLQTTVSRAMRLTNAGADGVVTVTIESLRAPLETQYRAVDDGLCRHVLGESEARNTAAAVALAASYIEKAFGGEAIMWVLPSDHYIGDEGALKRALEVAVQAAGEGRIVTFGIRPTRPETGYGYIRVRDATWENVRETAIKIEEFVEKPSFEKALAYLESGAYFWNSGMFVFNAAAVLKAFEIHAPAIKEGAAKAWTCEGENIRIDPDVYNQIEKQPFDKAIMEKCGDAAVVPTNPTWSDIGSWESLWEISEQDENGNAVKGDAILDHCQDTLVYAHDRKVVCHGVKNLVIADTKDAVLIADKTNGEAVKRIVEQMKRNAKSN